MDVRGQGVYRKNYFGEKKYCFSDKEKGLPLPSARLNPGFGLWEDPRTASPANFKVAPVVSINTATRHLSQSIVININTREKLSSTRGKSMRNRIDTGIITVTKNIFCSSDRPEGNMQEKIQKKGEEWTEQKRNAKASKANTAEQGTSQLGPLDSWVIKEPQRRQEFLCSWT